MATRINRDCNKSIPSYLLLIPSDPALPFVAGAATGVVVLETGGPRSHGD